MTVYKAGVVSQTSFANRCAQDLRCICEQRGNYDVFVDGVGPYCIIIDREDVKLELESVGINTSSIEATWLKADCIEIEKGSTIVSGGYKYKVKESPVNHYDGWCSAKLKLTCEC